jgi:hypothetical protein
MGVLIQCEGSESPMICSFSGSDSVEVEPAPTCTVGSVAEEDVRLSGDPNRQE